MSKQVAKRPQAEVPAYLTKGPALGTENIEMQDMAIPRLKIVQGLTRAKVNNKKLIDGAWYHSVTEQIICPPEEALDLYFILKWSGRIIFDDSLKFVASEYTDYNTKEKVCLGEVVDDRDPRWMDCINYFVVTRKDLIEGIRAGIAPDLLIYTAMSGSMGPAKKLNSHFKSEGKRGFSMFAHRVQATTSLEKFDKGNAYMPVFTPKGHASEKEHLGLESLYKVCRKLASTEAAQKETEKEDEEVKPQPQVEPQPSQGDPDTSFDFE